MQSRFTSKHNENEIPDNLIPTYGRKAFINEAPSLQFPNDPMDPREARRIIEDELDYDARNSADLGSYICDYMDPECDALIKRTLGKVYIDKSEYPAMAQIGDRVVNLLNDFFNGTANSEKEEREVWKVLGSPTIGSSEAIMLGLMAHRRNWEISWEKRKNQQISIDGQYVNFYRYDKPFLIYARDVHTCWNKYSNYFNTPALLLNLTDGQYILDPGLLKLALRSTVKQIIEVLDEQQFPTKQNDSNSTYQPFKGMADVLKDNLIYCDVGLHNTHPELKAIYENKILADLICSSGGVVGTTFTGQRDIIEDIDLMLAEAEKYMAEVENTGRSDCRIPIHVDAASGGFIAPFTDEDNTPKWDFRVERVKSINVSNHKFGMVYPGCGTVVFKDYDVVPQDLVNSITYLGGAFNDYNVNFSRGSAMVIAAYYNLIRFGRVGYENVVLNCIENTRYLVKEMQRSKKIGNLVEFIHDDVGDEKLTIVVFKEQNDPNGAKLALLSDELLKQGWRLPAYNLPFTTEGDADNPPDGIKVMRIVVRQDISKDKIDLLVRDMETGLENIERKINDGYRPLLEADSAENSFIGLPTC